jgi:hypothetical protein
MKTNLCITAITLLVGAAMGGCGDDEPTTSGTSSTTGTASTGGAGGSSAGGAGGAGGTTFACDPENPPVQAGDFTADVDAVLDNCRRCHSATPAPGFEGFTVPFFFDSYAETQADYFGKPVWLRMRTAAVDSMFMPLEPPALTPDELAVLDAWTAACAPPAPGT